MYPLTEGLFTTNDSPRLDRQRHQDFHTWVAKALFLCMWGRPDIQPTVAFLTTRVKEPTEEDWYKLIWMLRFLERTQEDILTITPETLNIVRFSVDASFAVHPDMRSHSGMSMSMGKGSILNSSKKQKINTRSSTEAELVAVDDNAAMEAEE